MNEKNEISLVAFNQYRWPIKFRLHSQQKKRTMATRDFKQKNARTLQ